MWQKWKKELTMVRMKASVALISWVQESKQPTLQVTDCQYSLKMNSSHSQCPRSPTPTYTPSSLPYNLYQSPHNYSNCTSYNAHHKWMKYIVAWWKRNEVKWNMKFKSVYDKCDIECGIPGSKGSIQNDWMLQGKMNLKAKEVTTFSRFNAGGKHEKVCVLFLDIWTFTQGVLSL